MKKVIVLGCSGSGKSAFARRLQERTGLPLVCLDNIWKCGLSSCICRKKLSHGNVRRLF